MRIQISFLKSAGMAALLGVLTSAYAAEPRPLNRSLYIPVHISTCEHLHGAILYEGEQVVGVLPAKRVFQFTYYPELERLAPEVIQIRIEGLGDATRDPFLARLAVTPDGIFSGGSRIELESASPMKKLRFKRDARYESVDLHIQCKSICSRAGARVTQTGRPSDLKSEPSQN